MKKRGLALLLSAAVVCSLAGCTAAGYEIVLDTDEISGNTVFTINDQKCREPEAKLYLCNYKNLYGTAYGVDLRKYEQEDGSLEDYIKSVTIDELSRIYCMEQIAKEQGMALDQQEKELVEQAAEQYYDSLSSEELSYMGITRDDLREYYTRYALAEKLYTVMTAGETEEVSDDDARVIRLNQILVKDRKSADRIKDSLDGGSDFAAVASSYGDEAEYEITPARGQLAEDVEAVVFDMEDGEIAGPIEADGGYYFFQCISKYEEKLTEANKQVLLEKRKAQRFTDSYGSFVEKSSCQLNEKNWEDVTVEPVWEDIRTDSFFSTYEKLAARGRAVDRAKE